MTVSIEGTTPGIAVDGTGAVVNVTVTTGSGGGGGGVTDHGLLTGLSDDDHTQYAKKASNLSDLADAPTARTNLGLGTAAVAATGDFATAAQGVDARTPTAHKTSHENGGTDELALDASQITTGTVAQDRLGTGSAGAGAKFLADDQTYKTVSSGIADPGGANDDFLQRKSGAWTYRTVAQVKTDLNLSSIPFTSGAYYSLGGGSSASSTGHGLTAAGRFTAMPVYLPAGSYSEIGVSVSTAAVSTWQFGVYANDPSTMRPDGQPLLASSGTADMNAGTGFVGASISLTLSSSAVVWLAAHCVAYTASPSVNCYTGAANVQPVLPWIGAKTLHDVAGRQPWGALVLNAGTGAIPSPGPTTSFTDLLPRLIVRAA